MMYRLFPLIAGFAGLITGFQVQVLFGSIDCEGIIIPATQKAGRRLVVQYPRPIDQKLIDMVEFSPIVSPEQGGPISLENYYVNSLEQVRRILGNARGRGQDIRLYVRNKGEQQDQNNYLELKPDENNVLYGESGTQKEFKQIRPAVQGALQIVEQQLILPIKSIKATRAKKSKAARSVSAQMPKRREKTPSLEMLFFKRKKEGAITFNMATVKQFAQGWSEYFMHLHTYVSSEVSFEQQSKTCAEAFGLEKGLFAEGLYLGKQKVKKPLPLTGCVKFLSKQSSLATRQVWRPGEIIHTGERTLLLPELSGDNDLAVLLQLYRLRKIFEGSPPGTGIALPQDEEKTLDELRKEKEDLEKEIIKFKLLIKSSENLKPEAALGLQQSVNKNNMRVRELVNKIASKELEEMFGPNDVKLANIIVDETRWENESRESAERAGTLRNSIRQIEISFIAKEIAWRLTVTESYWTVMEYDPERRLRTYYPPVVLSSSFVERIDKNAHLQKFTQLRNYLAQT